MSTVIAVWSKVLLPGQDALIDEDVSIQITNITLEIDESSLPTLIPSRSVVKMQHLEAEPALLQAAAGYDLSSDSDYESDSELESDEEDEGEDDNSEGKLPPVLRNTIKNKPRRTKPQVNGVLPEDDDDDEEDENFLPKEDKDEDAIEDEDDSQDEGEDNEDEDEKEEDSEDLQDAIDDYENAKDPFFDRGEAQVQICSLLPGTFEQVQTNVILPGGEDFVFTLSGKHKVHLFGHYIIQPRTAQFDEPPYGQDGQYDSDEITSDDDDELSEGELGHFDPETGLMVYDEDDEDSDEEDDDRFMEIEDERSPPKKSKKPSAAVKSTGDVPATAKPAKTVDSVPTSIPSSTTAASTKESDNKAKLSKNQLKKQAKKEQANSANATASKKDESVAAVPKSAPALPAAATITQDKKETKSVNAAPPSTTTTATAAAKKAPSAKQVLPSGLSYEDNKVGTGSAAKSGQRVQMRYIGRLQNGKIFDQNTKGAPFSFKLGKGEVIKGWDQGIAGMQVGGERKLIIPPGLAYGKQAISGIPANSTLTFEVKLLSIK